MYPSPKFHYVLLHVSRQSRQPCFRDTGLARLEMQKLNHPHHPVHNKLFLSDFRQPCVLKRFFTEWVYFSVLLV